MESNQGLPARIGATYDLETQTNFPEGKWSLSALMAGVAITASPIHPGRKIATFIESNILVEN
jgi:hypothetical protein